MASKLCCIVEQDEDGSDSPEPLNSRISQATPAKRPLLNKEAGSPNSRFTSARSEDLHELQEIFDNAQDDEGDQALPLRTIRPRFSRPSMQSLRSLHKMTSMRSMIRRKFSRDLTVKPVGQAPVHHQAEDKTSLSAEPDTVVRQLRDGPNQQLNITKDDLRKDLLSDKKLDEGGYDSDAEMLDDIARKVGKKTPSKRRSIHSIDWSPSTGSRPTPGSSTKGRSSAELKRDLEPYHIENTQSVSLSHRLSQVFSTPNLRVNTSGAKEPKLRHSHSATSMGLPKPSPISPLRLPSLTTHDSEGVPWSEVMHRSLRLSQFPVPPRYVEPKASETTLDVAKPSHDCTRQHRHHKSTATTSSSRRPTAIAPNHAVQIRVQQPTSIASPRASTSMRGSRRENALPNRGSQAEGGRNDYDDDENPRRSVHLYSMRISHHLRSGSLLSWDQSGDAPDLPAPPHAFRERTVSDQSRRSQRHTQVVRHDRQTSSSGFTSSKVPSRWGKVMPTDRGPRADVASSIYSSRPQSPPDSFGGSTVSISRTGTAHHNPNDSSIDLKSPRRSNSFPTGNQATPRASLHYAVTDLTSAQHSTVESSLLPASPLLARKNSVADTKTSKFREEFSPSPPKRKLTPSTSFIKFLNPKRLSMRSQSEANIQPDSPGFVMDGLADMLPVPADRERRQSRSLMSLQTEQGTLGKTKGADHVWNQALQAHQAEKASLFLPKNRELAVHASPFRERSGSVSVRRTSMEEGVDPTTRTEPGVNPVPTPLSANNRNDQVITTFASRRSALVEGDDVVSTTFEQQGDGTEVVGAWGRYPSHTRHDRTFSAGKVDRVETRDFALEAAIKFASARSNTHDDDLVDPTERKPSPALLPREKKRKKKVGSTRVAKSNSMTFGKNLMKNYTKMFKSQSTEFRRHGRGHRSSIASGGILEFPELEIVPDVWTGAHTGGTGAFGYSGSDEINAPLRSRRSSVTHGMGNLPAEDSMATLRPRRNSSAPNLNEMSFRDGADDAEHTHDRARVWSVYYENCVDSFSRLSTEDNTDLQDFGGASRLSFDSKHASMHSHTLPTRLARHSRNTSQLSRTSNVSRGSAQPSVLSTGEVDGTSEERSLVSVRRSTMDLIMRFKEQEATEHDKVMALARMESRKEKEGLLS